MGSKHGWAELRDNYPHVDVKFVPLGPGILAVTHHDLGEIHVTPSLRTRQRQLRSVIKHETRHLARGEVFAQDNLKRREERAVDRESAVDLIDIEELIDGLVWCGNEYELAEQLWVSVDMLRTRLAELTDNESEYIARELDRREVHIP